MFSPQRLFGKCTSTIRKSRRARVRFLRPFIQQLEDRVMLSTLLVNNPTDAHVADETSLREAIVQANTDAAAGTSDTITFDPSLGSSTINLTQGQLELSGAGGADGHRRHLPDTHRRLHPPRARHAAFVRGHGDQHQQPGHHADGHRIVYHAGD